MRIRIYLPDCCGCCERCRAGGCPGPLTRLSRHDGLRQIAIHRQQKLRGYRIHNCRRCSSLQSCRATSRIASLPREEGSGIRHHTAAGARLSPKPSRKTATKVQYTAPCGAALRRQEPEPPRRPLRGGFFILNTNWKGNKLWRRTVGHSFPLFPATFFGGLLLA